MLLFVALEACDDAICSLCLLFYSASFDMVMIKAHIGNAVSCRRISISRKAESTTENGFVNVGNHRKKSRSNASSVVRRNHFAETLKGRVCVLYSFNVMIVLKGAEREVYEQWTMAKRPYFGTPRGECGTLQWFRIVVKCSGRRSIMKKCYYLLM